MSREQEKKLFDAITQVRDDLIEQAQDTSVSAARPMWQRWGAVAACAILVFGIGGFLLQNLHLFMSGFGAGGSGHAEGTVFMSYAGPILPLTLRSQQDGVSASRHISYDFSLANEEFLSVRGAQVRDGYTLYNSSHQEKNVTALYPFTGDFDSLSELKPSILVNGQAVQPILHAGSYSGGFTGAVGDGEEGSLNLKLLNSWEGYKTLLEDGRYLERALSPYPTLSQKVIVYEFTDFTAPLEEYPAATYSIAFTIDPKKTCALQYGFEGTEWDENGYRRFSTFVPDGVSMRPERKLLIVLGDDISEYQLQGYKNGLCEEGNRLDGVTANITRHEAVLSDVVRQLAAEYFLQYGNGDEGFPSGISEEMFIGAVAELLYQYGVFSDMVAERYEYGSLLDVFSETCSLKRVMYLEFPLVIPAGGSVSIEASLHKNPSRDFSCSGSENAGLQGYDMLTQLGSNLRFETLTAEITNTKNIEIVRGNFGFDLSQNITSVDLDPAIEHYYLEIRPIEDNVNQD